MISIKEYAESRKRSYEAIRKLVAEYTEELHEHIVVQGRTRLLDDYAVTFLDQKRNYETTTVVVRSEEDLQRIKSLEEELNQLRQKMGEVSQMLMKSQDDLIRLQNERIGLLEGNKQLLEDKGTVEREKVKTEVLLEESNKRLEEKSRELEESTRKLDQTTAALDQERKRYKKTWFGLYKRIEE